MSNEVTEVNIENSQGEQPSHLEDQNSEIAMCSTINSVQLNIDSEVYSNKQINIQDKLMNESETMSIRKEEETLVEKVNKLELSVTKPEEKKSNVDGVVIQNKISESLNFLQNYNSDSEDSNSSSSSSESSSESQDVVSESDEVNEELDDSDDLFCEGSSTGKQRKKEDKSLHELMADFGINQAPKKIPDISSLALTNSEEFIHMGNIACILGQYVTVEGLPAMPAYDLDTLLFVEEGRKVLGYIFDVMGPVAAPMYVVTLDSIETAENLQLKKGTKIYCAPKSKYTKYVFVHELMKVRGSDASWVGDVEVPPEFEEFSDDEEERKRKSLKNKATKRKRGSLERHQQFEANMNKINQLNSRLHTLKDARKYLVRDQKTKDAGCSSSNVQPKLVTNYYQQPQVAAFDGYPNCSQFVPDWRTYPSEGYASNYSSNQSNGQNNFYEECAFFPPPSQAYYTSAFYPMNATMTNQQNNSNFRPNDGSGPSSGC